MRWIAVLSLVVSACATGTGVDTSAVPASTSSPSVVTSLPPTTSSVPPTTVLSASSVCDSYSDPVALGSITDPELIEVSGIAVGSEGVIWVHNDSGSVPQLWALDDSAAVLRTVAVSVRNIDWEDISIGPGPDGVAYLYLADIGDNLERRASVTLHRFVEPGPSDDRAEEIESLSVTYPGGSVNAESFFVDPSTGDSFIVTKTATGRSSVFRIPSGAWSQPSAEAQHVATIDLGALSLVTAGSISPDGSVIALRTYLDVWLWERRTGETVADALRGVPCRAPAAAEPQGEALGFDGTGYLTISEGVGSVIYRVTK
ncbi:MAG: hypothetical protein V3U50_01670 [Acidimicrobiia bacterium]